ncbi:MAG: DUF4290 domain-containing protein [Bacteroidota bacterium]|nr:DUF4290 domain-containing protein [Bacteroidota bacterium]
MNLEYNTSRDKLVISEYGRHIQKLVNHAINIQDRKDRQRFVEGIINIMGDLNPHLRDVVDFKHKLWDHIFVISNFKLDVDSPYEKPVIETLSKKPDPLNYPKNEIRFNHYGKVIELLIKEAITVEDDDIKKQLTIAIANQMKRSYVNWNNDTVEDELIFAQLSKLSKGNLQIPEGIELVKHTPSVKTNTRKKKKRNKNQQKNK